MRATESQDKLEIEAAIAFESDATEALPLLRAAGAQDSVDVEVAFDDDSDTTDVLPYLSIALDRLESPSGTQSRTVESYRNRRAANDFVDDDATLPLPALEDEHTDIQEKPPRWWKRAKSYIGL